LLYFGFGLAALGVWACAPNGHKVEVVPIVFLAGGVALLLKGSFLLRKTSDGLARSRPLLDLGKQEVTPPYQIPTRKTLTPVPAVVAQLVQDFGAAAFLLGPVLHYANEATDYSNNLPSFQVFLSEAGLLLAGLLIRRLTPPPRIQG